MLEISGRAGGPGAFLTCECEKTEKNKVGELGPIVEKFQELESTVMFIESSNPQQG